MSKTTNLIWQDAQGEQLLSVVNTTAGISGIKSALLAKSNAVIVQQAEGDLQSFNVIPSTSTYSSSRTMAILIFKDSRTNSTGKLFLPAPDPSIFMGGGDTVDPAQIAGIIAAAEGSLLAGSGNTVDMFVGGYLNKGRIAPLEGTDVVAFVNPMSALGDMIYANDSAGDAAALPIGSSGQVLSVVSGIPAWTSVPGLPLTASSALLGSPVTMTNPNQFYDGPTLTLAAGSWFVVGWITAAINVITDFSAKLWDGTTVYASGGVSSRASTSGDVTVTLARPIVLGGSTSIRMAMAGNNGGASILATLNTNAAGATASGIAALKYA